MNFELKDTGLILLQVDYVGNILTMQKDENFNFDFENLTELLNKGKWLKMYERTRKSHQNQTSRPVKVDKTWVKMEMFARSEHIDITITNVSKLQSERLVIIRSIVNKGYLLSSRLMPIILGLGVFLWFGKAWLDTQNETEKRKDLRLAKELKEERKNWFVKMQKQDSVLIAQTNLLQEINSNLKNTSNQNKIIAQLTRFYKIAEEQNLELLTDLAVIDYMLPEKSEHLSEIKKFQYTERYIVIKDSLENARERKHKPFRQ